MLTHTCVYPTSATSLNSFSEAFRQVSRLAARFTPRTCLEAQNYDLHHFQNIIRMDYEPQIPYTSLIVGTSFPNGSQDSYSIRIHRQHHAVDVVPERFHIDTSSSDNRPTPVVHPFVQSVKMAGTVRVQGPCTRQSPHSSTCLPIAPFCFKKIALRKSFLPNDRVTEKERYRSSPCGPARSATIFSPGRTRQTRSVIQVFLAAMIASSVHA